MISYGPHGQAYLGIHFGYLSLHGVYCCPEIFSQLVEKLQRFFVSYLAFRHVPSMYVTELSELPSRSKLLGCVALFSRESTLNINSLIANPSRQMLIASIPLTLSFSSQLVPLGSGLCRVLLLRITSHVQSRENLNL